MALITCSDCGRQVSDQAAACPQCGRPMPTAAERDRAAEMARRAAVESETLASSAAPSTRHRAVAASSDNGPWGVAAIVTAAVIGVSVLVVTLASAPKSTEVGADIAASQLAALSGDTTGAAASLPAGGTAPPAVEASPLGLQWQYVALDDELSRGRVYTATLVSDNTVDFEFPYQGVQHGTLQLRTHPRYGTDVIFQIERGQMPCHSYSEDCTVIVRFDDGPPQTFSAAGPESDESTTLFISNYTRFVTAMKKARRVRIAPLVYQHGRPVFEFDVSGFSTASYRQPATPVANK